MEDRRGKSSEVNFQSGVLCIIFVIKEKLQQHLGWKRWNFSSVSLCLSRLYGENNLAGV